MTATTIRVQMAQRKDTAANWTAANPILLSGEIGYETDTKKFKTGDGTTNWNSLAYLPIPDGSGNLTITGNLEIGTTGSLTFEGSTANGFETTLAVTDPTADRTITLPNVSGTVVTTGDTGSVTSTMLADGTIVNADISGSAEIAVSKLANGTANQVIVTDGTNVSWSDNLTLAGDLTVNGTTTTINTENLLVEDKNIIIGNVATPSDVTADGGGITLKGATDKTINWVDATDAWTSSERFSYPLGSATAPALTFTGDPNTGIYSPGAHQVAISTNGTGRLFVNASGNLLANTTSLVANTYSSIDKVYYLSGSADGLSPELVLVNQASTANATSAITFAGRRTNFGVVARIQSDRLGNITIGNNDAANGSSSVNERLRIDSSGRLLVGTSSARTNFFNLTNIGPALQVEGNGTAGSSASFTRNSADSAPPSLILAKSRSTGYAAVSSGDALGRIPFMGADGSELVEAALILAEVDGTPGANDMPGRLVFSTTADGASSPTERMRIDNKGRTDITCVKDGSQALYVAHNGTSGQQYGINITTANDQNNNTTYFLQCVGSATNRATILTNGGIQNYSANNVNLSDRNVKKDIAPAAGTWDCLKEWEIVNFRYKDQPDDADLNMGVIAQQVAESCPEVITVFQEATEDQPEKLGVKDQQMMWMAIKTLQEAQLRIETLEAEVAALKGA
jgi:hypothetical protein